MLTIPSLGKDIQHLRTSYTPVGNIDSYKQLASFLNIKHIPTLQPSPFTPKYLIKKNESMCLYKDLDKFICGYICSGQEQETTQCSSTSKWINKLMFIHKMVYDSAIKRNEFLINAVTWWISK